MRDSRGDAGAAPEGLGELIAGARAAREAFERGGAVAALSGAVGAWEDATTHPSLAGLPAAIRVALLDEAARAAVRLHQVTGESGATALAIRALERVIAAAPDAAPERATALGNLAACLKDRFERAGAPPDLSRAIDCGAAAVAATPPDDGALAGRLTNLGGALHRRYVLLGVVDDLDRAIAAQETAFGRTHAGDPRRHGRSHNLAIALRDRYDRTGDAADLERAVAAHEVAADVADDDPAAPLFARHLGNVLLQRHERSGAGQPDDLARAIAAHEWAVSRVPPGSAARPAHLNDLAVALRERYRREGEAADLARAIAHLGEALAESSPAAPDRATILHNLGSMLLERFRRDGARADLARAIGVYARAARRTARAAPARADRLHALGDALRERHARDGRHADLTRALAAYRLVVALTPPTSPRLPLYLNSLGNGLRDRFARRGDPADLDRAIAAYERAAAVPVDALERPMVLVNLGIALRQRYELRGDTGELTRAIVEHERAVAATPDASPALAGRLSILGNSLRARYRRTGEAADLDRALACHERAVEIPAPGSPYRGAYLHNLANGLRLRERRGRDIADLDRAIGLYREALAGVAPDAPDWPAYRQDLASALLARHQREGAPDGADLDAALAGFEAALRASPPGSPGRAARLDGVALALLARFEREGDAADLDRGVALQREALAATPEGAPERLPYLDRLGLLLESRSRARRDPADLDGAIRAWEEAWSALLATFAAVPVDYKLGQQRNWYGLADRLIAAYRRRASGAGTGAPADLRRVLELVEGGKSRLLVSLLGREAPRARAGIPAAWLAEERRLLAELTALDLGELAGRDADPAEAIHPVEPDPLVPIRRRQACWQALQGLWAEMASGSAAGADYVALRRGDTPSWAELARLAGDPPGDTALVSLHVGDEASLLLVIRAGAAVPAVVEVPLGAASWADALRRAGREMRARREETWDRALMPLLAAARDHLFGADRVVLAPAGAGHGLPWAVAADRAGWRDGEGRPLPVVTVPALGVFRRPPRRRAPGARALVVGDPAGNLPGAAREAAAVAGRLGATALLGAAATRGAVLGRLARATHIHLATHALFEPSDPLGSRVALADGAITAREILARRLRAELLVLSACETGVAGVLAGEELAGLAHAFLHAGARALLVSLWRVPDPATAALLSAFYDALLAGGDEAAALASAMATVRSQPGWEHPYYWGGFVFTGTRSRRRGGARRVV